MSRHSRKRVRGAKGAAARRPAPERAPAAPRPAARTADDRPRAPWHPFPLVELCVLAGLVLLVWGLLRSDERGGRILLVCGMAIASLGGLETALREHFTGYRSHVAVLAGLPAVLTAGVLFFARAPWIAIPLAGAAVFALVAVPLRRAFRRRS